MSALNSEQMTPRRGPINLSTPMPRPSRKAELGFPSGAAMAALSPERSAWGELKEQSVLAFESGLLPRAIDSRQKAVTIAMMGRELGLSPMQSLCGIYVVNGMAALRGSLMLRLIYERVPGATITVVTPSEKAHEECTVEMQRPGGKVHSFRFTLEDAKKAGFSQKPIWQQHTSTMLRWAAIRTGARIVFADAIAGCYMEDELPASESAPEHVEKPAPTEAQPVTEEIPHTPIVTKRVVSDLPGENAMSARRVTEKQINRLYAIAHQQNWTRAEIGVWIEKWYKKARPEELSRLEYDKLCNFLLTSPAKHDSESRENHS